MSSFRTFLWDFSIMIMAGWTTSVDYYYNMWSWLSFLIPVLSPLMALFIILDIRKLQSRRTVD